MKRIIALTLIFILSVPIFSMSSCAATKAPEIEEVRDRFVYLIEESKNLNVLFFGDGLPVYEREDALSERYGIYFEDTLPQYNRVMGNSRYITLDDIKRRAAQIYSTEYLGAVCETAIDGVLTGSGSAYLRFYDDGKWIHQNKSVNDPDKVFKLSERIYDYSSMRMIMPSDAEYVNILIESYTLEKNKSETIGLSFAYENGNWYLDSPTY